MWLVSTVGDLGFVLLLFIVAIFIAGALLPNGERASELARKVSFLVAGNRGPRWLGWLRRAYEASRAAFSE